MSEVTDSYGRCKPGLRFFVQDCPRISSQRPHNRVYTNIYIHHHKHQFLRSLLLRFFVQDCPRICFHHPHNRVYTNIHIHHHKHQFLRSLLLRLLCKTALAYLFTAHTIVFIPTCIYITININS